MSAVGPVCIDCHLSNLISKIFKIWLEMQKNKRKKNLNSNIVNNHLQLYIMVFFIYFLSMLFGTFSFFNWLKFVNLKCFHEIKYIRNVRIFFSFWELAMWMQLPCMMCLHLGNFKCFYKKIFLDISPLHSRSQVTFKNFFFYDFAMTAFFLYILDSKAIWLQIYLKVLL